MMCAMWARAALHFSTLTEITTRAKTVRWPQQKMVHHVNGMTIIFHNVSLLSVLDLNTLTFVRSAQAVFTGIA